MNILLLGETGVGKSTWINGLQTYLNFSSLKAAEKGNLVSQIPIFFKEIDKNLKVHDIQEGCDENEVHEPGSTATQHPKTYIFKAKDITIRIIDTPGIVDTRGKY